MAFRLLYIVAALLLSSRSSVLSDLEQGQFFESLPAEEELADSGLQVTTFPRAFATHAPLSSLVHEDVLEEDPLLYSGKEKEMDNVDFSSAADEGSTFEFSGFTFADHLAKLDTDLYSGSGGEESGDQMSGSGSFTDSVAKSFEALVDHADGTEEIISIESHSSLVDEDEEANVTQPLPAIDDQVVVITSESSGFAPDFSSAEAQPSSTTTTLVPAEEEKKEEEEEPSPISAQQTANEPESDTASRHLWPFSSLFQPAAWSEWVRKQRRKSRVMSWYQMLSELGVLQAKSEVQNTTPKPVERPSQLEDDWNRQEVHQLVDDSTTVASERVVVADEAQSTGNLNVDNVIDELRHLDNDRLSVDMFDGQELTRCSGELHPVVKVFRLLKRKDILAQYKRSRCQIDYHVHCQYGWKACDSVEAKTFCPKTCNQPHCAHLKLHGYAEVERPVYVNTCEDTKSHDCYQLQERGDCFTNTNSMSQLCPDACHFCPADEPYLPFMAEAEKLLVWLNAYQNGTYKAYADYIRSRTMIIHAKVKGGLC